MKLIIGNRAYSSWSMRGWLAVKQSGLEFDTRIIPMDTPEWLNGSAKGEMPSGKVPVVWDGEVAVWDSLAIILWLADRTTRDRYWPETHAARALAYAMTAEMHSGFAALRTACPMNLQQRFPAFSPTDAVLADVARIDALWTEARTTFGATGPYLFGDFGAADIMFAPVVTRIDSYGLKVGDTAQAYVAAMLAHPWMAEWTAAARVEDFPFDRYPIAGGVPAAGSA